MKRIIIDLDDTITHDDKAKPYSERLPNMAVLEKMRQYKTLGFTIVIYSSRNMLTYQGDIGKINVHTLPVILEWLRRYDIPHDEVHVGKPWCGTEGFYVDDRAIRPDEFVRLTLEQITDLIRKEPTW